MFRTTTRRMKLMPTQVKPSNTHSVILCCRYIAHRKREKKTTLRLNKMLTSVEMPVFCFLFHCHRSRLVVSLNVDSSELACCSSFSFFVAVTRRVLGGRTWKVTLHHFSWRQTVLAWRPLWNCDVDIFVFSCCCSGAASRHHAQGALVACFVMATVASKDGGSLFIPKSRGRRFNLVIHFSFIVWKGEFIVGWLLVGVVWVWLTW